jgi:hypothetical protein
MHPDVLQKGPGKCPKCSMDLEALNKSTADKAPTDDHGGHRMGMGGAGMDHSGHQMGAGGHGGHAGHQH